MSNALSTKHVDLEEDDHITVSPTKSTRPKRSASPTKATSKAVKSTSRGKGCALSLSPATISLPSKITPPRRSTSPTKHARSKRGVVATKSEAVQEAPETIKNTKSTRAKRSVALTKEEPSAKKNASSETRMATKEDDKDFETFPSLTTARWREANKHAGAASHPILTLASRIKGALYGVLIGDALGGPVQFKARGTFTPVTDLRYVEPFDMPPGAWSDDGSLTLCIAQSLIDTDFTYSQADFIVKLVAWGEHGYLSSADYAWDIGNATGISIRIWSDVVPNLSHSPDKPDVYARDGKKPELLTKAKKLVTDVESGQQAIDKALNREYNCGNGSLMRIAPVGLAFFKDVTKAMDVARENSGATHPNVRCGNACAIYVKLVAEAIGGATKDDLAKSLATSDVSNRVLRERLQRYTTVEDWKLRESRDIKASGYVVDTLEAALWAFFSTDTWEKGALTVVNLGDDSDSTGAVYGGLAGAFYGLDAVPEAWRNELAKKELVDKIVDDFAKGAIMNAGMGQQKNLFK